MKKYYYIYSSLLFAAAIIISSCSGGGGGGSAPFSQADLEGTWYVSILQSSQTLSDSNEPGWIRGTATVYSSGTISIPTMETSAGNSSGPEGVVWTIDPWTGVVKESGTGNPDFHGKLAANKQLIVGTATNLNSKATTTTVQLRILQKIVSNPSYTISHIAGKTFMVHQIESGASGDWMYAEGSTDPVSSEPTTTVTLSSPVTKPTGTGPGNSPGYLSIASSGLVSLNSNSSFQGMLSPDKTYMVATETATDKNNIYRLTIVQMKNINRIYKQPDLAGTWSIHSILSSGQWLHATAAINAAGSGAITSWQNNFNADPPGTFKLDLASDGTILDTSTPDPTLHGFLSPSNDLWVMTQTMGGYGSGMSIVVK